MVLFNDERNRKFSGRTRQGIEKARGGSLYYGEKSFKFLIIGNSLSTILLFLPEKNEIVSKAD